MPCDDAVMRLAWFAVVAVWGCGEVKPNKLPDAPTGDGATPDTAIDAPDVDAPPPRCDPGKPFGVPVEITELNSTASDTSAALTPDELTITFASARPGGLGGFDAYIATRTSRTAPWGAPSLIAGVNTQGNDSRPHMSADQLTMYLEHTVSLSSGEYNIVAATRTSTSSAFSTPVAVGPVNTANPDTAPYVLPDHSAMYLVNNRMLWRATRTGTTWSAPTVVAGTNLQAGDFDYPAATPDELTIYFASSRGPSQGSFDIFMATRASVVAGFDAPVNVAALSSNRSDSPGWVSADNCVIYFARDVGAAGAGANYDLYRAEKPL